MGAGFARARFSRARKALIALSLLPALPVLYLLAGLAGALTPGPIATTPASGEEVRVGLIRGPIHFDFLLPLDAQLKERFAFAEAAGVPLSHPEAEWLILGWGAREFYTATGRLQDIALGPVVRAITGDRSVIRLDVAGAVDGSEAVRFLSLSAGQYQALLQGIEQEFARDGAGQVGPEVAEGLGQSDAFFAGTSGFNLVATCNAWVGEQLRGAGVAFGHWTPTVHAVELSLWRHGLTG